jgi:hypothetical protein
MLRYYGIIILSDHCRLSIHATLPKLMSAGHPVAMVYAKSEPSGNEVFDIN